jgi:small nuclear ribonucleoprotein (snRNP)-like protein
MAGNSLLQDELERLEGERVIVVMEDERSLKGTVESFDEEWLKLSSVTMKTTMNDRGWAEVTINTGEINKRFTEKGVYTEQDGGRLVSLEAGIVSLDGVLRVWAWQSENVTEPENVTHETGAPAGPTPAPEHGF